MTAVAGIDIGSNSVRLLAVDAAGQPLAREMHITRLAQGVDADGRLAPEAMRRTVNVLQDYGDTLRHLGVTRVRIGATSAARDASNCAEFFQLVERAVGTAPELLSGQTEAALSFAGATADRTSKGESLVLLDIGGGSTEFARGREEPESSISLNIGCVRITERFLKNDPPTIDEMDAATRFIRGELNKVDPLLPCRTADTWLGVAGTVTSLAALDAGLTGYDSSVTHGYRLQRSRVAAMHTRLAALSIQAREPLLISPKRGGVMIGGTLILQEILRFFDVEELIVSERDILDGLVASLQP